MQEIDHIKRLDELLLELLLNADIYLVMLLDFVFLFVFDRFVLLLLEGVFPDESAWKLWSLDYYIGKSGYIAIKAPADMCVGKLEPSREG